MKSYFSNTEQRPPWELKVSLHLRQFQVLYSPNRFRVLVAGRRFGKSELALAELIKAALEAPDRIIWYIGPSEKQAKSVIWSRLKAITTQWQAGKPLEGERRIDFKNGSSIVVKGAFDPDSLRGQGLDFVVIDEAADVKPEAWYDVLRPALADRLGRALFMGTPKGRNHFYVYFENAKTDPDWAAFQFTTEQGGIVQQSELQAVARQMDSNTYRRELQAEFGVVGDYRAYLGFDHQANIREVRFEPSLPLIWSLDFNVDPMCMLLMQKSGEDVHVLQEIIVRSNTSSTETACHAFLQQAEPYLKIVRRFYGALEVHAYGDASGNQRRTSAAATDWTIIREFFRFFHQGEIELFCRFANINPHVRDRVNCVNARLKSNCSDPRLFINPSCKELIRDLEEVCFKIDSTGAPTNDLNKSDRNRTHLSDALGYYISQIFPLRGFNKL